TAFDYRRPPGFSRGRRIFELPILGAGGNRHGNMLSAVRGPDFASHGSGLDWKKMRVISAAPVPTRGMVQLNLNNYGKSMTRWPFPGASGGGECCAAGTSLLQPPRSATPAP